MTTLALDLGTLTGWALRTADGSIVSGTESFKPQRFEGGGMRYLRFRRCARGHSPSDDNEADALALLAWAQALGATA